MSEANLDQRIKEKRAILRAMRAEHRRRQRAGAWSWGDFHRVDAIKRVEAELRELRASEKTTAP